MWAWLFRYTLVVVTFILYKVPRAAIALKEINCVADLKRQHYCQVPSGKGHFCYSKLFEFNVLTTEDTVHRFSVWKVQSNKNMTKLINPCEGFLCVWTKCVTCCALNILHIVAVPCWHRYNVGWALCTSVSFNTLEFPQSCAHVLQGSTSFLTMNVLLTLNIRLHKSPLIVHSFIGIF